jgi:hypothetical protein
MRRSTIFLGVCAVVALASCAPAEEPAVDEPSEASVAAEPVPPGESAPGSFESGDTRGWDSAQGDKSRTDFESGDASAWSDSQGTVQEGSAPAPKEDDDDDGQ